MLVNETEVLNQIRLLSNNNILANSLKNISDQISIALPSKNCSIYALNKCLETLESKKLINVTKTGKGAGCITQIQLLNSENTEPLTKEIVLSFLKRHSENGVFRMSNDQVRDELKYVDFTNKAFSNILFNLKKEKLIDIKNLYGEYILEFIKDKNVDVKQIQESMGFSGIIIYDTDKGKGLAISDIAKTLMINPQNLYYMIERNKRLFEDFIGVAQNSKCQKIQCLNKDGIIGIIFKMNYTRFSEEKQEFILKFQKWCIKTLGKVASEGQVILSDKEHLNIQDNIKEILDLSSSNMDELYNNLNDALIVSLNNLQALRHKSADQRQALRETRSERDMLRESLQASITNRVELKNQLLHEKMNNK